MQYTIKSDKAFYDLVEEMRERPAMYLGVASLVRLQAYVHGFSHACEKFDKEEPQQTVLPLPFWFFHEFTKNYYSAASSVCGWCNLILDNNNKDDEKSLAVFYKLIDVYKNLNVANCEVAEISERHHEYNMTNKNAPKYSIGSNPKLLSVFHNAKNVFIYELSDNVGYVVLIELENEFQIVMQIEPQKNKIIKYFDKIFGKKLKWKGVEFNNMLTKNYTFAPIDII